MTINETVFDVVHGFAQKFYSASKVLPAQTDFMPLTASLCFTVLGVNLAIPVEELSEVHQVPNYTRLPGVKPWMMGVANIRGKLVPIIDFAKFLGGERSLTSKARRVLVIELQGNFIGILVESVAGVRHFDAEQYCDEPTDACGLLAPYIQGCFVDDSGKENFLFQPSQLGEDKSFQDAAL
jgi:twitching motility protein PilI